MENILLRLFELPDPRVLPDLVPVEGAPVHGDVHPRREHLNVGHGRPEVEHPVGGTEGVGDHGAGEDDRLAHVSFLVTIDAGVSTGIPLLFPLSALPTPELIGYVPGGLHHGICAVGNEDALLLRLQAVVGDKLPVLVRDGLAVHHHERANGHRDPGPSPGQDVRDLGVLEIELTVQLVVLLVEGSSGDEDADGHGRRWLVRGFKNIGNMVPVQRVGMGAYGAMV